MAEIPEPFHVLRQHPELTYALRTDLPPGVDAFYWPIGDRAAIGIRRSLTRRQRRVALAHELRHHLRGGGICWFGADPKLWTPVMLREEARIDDEVARWLVPHDQLIAYLDCAEELDGYVSPHQVAEAFNVTDTCAQRSMRLLASDANYRVA